MFERNARMHESSVMISANSVFSLSSFSLNSGEMGDINLELKTLKHTHKTVIKIFRFFYITCQFNAYPTAS